MRQHLLERERRPDTVAVGGVHRRRQRGELADPLAASAAAGAELVAVADGEDPTISRSPAATIAAMAPVSAHAPCGYAAFSTLHPLKICPLGVSTAAPTR